MDRTALLKRKLYMLVLNTVTVKKKMSREHKDRLFHFFIAYFESCGIIIDPETALEIYGALLESSPHIEHYNFKEFGDNLKSNSLKAALKKFMEGEYSELFKKDKKYISGRLSVIISGENEGALSFDDNPDNI